jgi:hypothetical protein
MIPASAQCSKLATIFDQLGETMSQGQGAYFVGFSTPAGSNFTSMQHSHRLINVTLGSDGTPTSTRTVVYVPRSEASTVDVKTSVSESVTALNVEA